MIEHKFREVLERDIDMLILEEFTCSINFSKIFLDKLNIHNAILSSTWQSKMDSELGESDITVVFDYKGKKIALLIEDKIDALAMPEQPSRYILRGNKGIAANEYDEFSIFIVAPNNYLNNNEKAKEYPNKVSYEEIRSYFEQLNDPRSSFKLAQLNLAIDKQKNGYQTVKNEAVTNFWNKYIEYKNTHFPDIDLIVGNTIKPSKGIWACFRTSQAGVLIYHKSNKGYIDLTFNKCCDKIEEIKRFLIAAIGNYHEQGYTVVKTGKSCAIRICVSTVDFLLPFEPQAYFVRQSFEAVKRLSKLFDKLDFLGINQVLAF